MAVADLLVDGIRRCEDIRLLIVVNRLRIGDEDAFLRCGGDDFIGRRETQNSSDCSN